MSQLTRKAIMKCTLELAEKKSLKKITVKDIADECGITRSTFYYHFSDIYDVLDGVVQAKIDEFNEEYNGEIDVYKRQLNNRKQAYKLMKFMDSFAIPYTLVFGNHDCEMGSTCNKEELAQIYKKGKYCIFTEGRKELTGVGNFFINLTSSDENVLLLSLIHI